MKPFVNYIIEAGLSLGVFTLVYWFILRQETRFKATRIYLLLALLFSTLLPFLSIKLNFFNELYSIVRQEQNTEIGTNLLGTVTVFASGIPSRVSNAILTFDYSVIIYRLGAFAALFILLSGIFQLFLRVSKNRVFKLNKARLVVSEKEQSPYSFFNFIFIGKDLTEQENWKSMVHHELEHAKQGHSFDVLFVDFMMIFQWFNPFYWMIRRMVRENHEFLADNGVLSRGAISTGRYKELLLSQAIGGRPVITSNFFNVKTVKKRFKMITKNNHKTQGILKYSLGVVMALALTLLFACEDFDRSLIHSSNASKYIYDGKFMELAQIQEIGIKNLQIVEGDQLDVLLVYSELKDELEEGKYYMAFNADDVAQMKLCSKLDVNSMNNEVDETVVVAYGMEKSANYDEEVFVIVEDMPEFTGGELALRKHIGTYVKYPAEAAVQGIQGKVYVTFVVGSDGVVKKAKIARGVNPLLDAEAIRVVNSLPKWKPGYQSGKPVAVYYTVPINFQLE
ncbi:MAG: M56 family metallopeptidase [Prolixibacteraceae bacterium]|jgi:TonB family protein|nr:M56 family metallopeptidase [Prolixibacteraceae bacterium]